MFIVCTAATDFDRVFVPTSLPSTGLSAEQQEDVRQLLDFEKRERKLRIKQEAAEFKLKQTATARDKEKHHATSTLTKQQKAVMTRAFQLYENDRRKDQRTMCIDSTEWKRMRALGGASPVLCSYLKRAGWNPAWPAPKPEGRLLRREGQRVALARYTRRGSAQS